MEKKNILLFLLCGLFQFQSCTDENIQSTKPAEDRNEPPRPFTVSVLEVSSDYAVINWDPAYEEENEVVHYSIFLENTKLEDQLTKDRIYKIEGLLPDHLYTGKIIATDLVNEPVKAEFSFTTSKDLFKFDRLFAGYGGRIPEGYAVNNTSDGGLIVAALLPARYGLDENIFIKLDSKGFEQWQTRTSVGVGDFGTVCETQDGGYLTSSGGAIIKLNENGALHWQVAERLVYGVVETADQEYVALITGGLLAKYDQGGSLLWKKAYQEIDYTTPKWIAICNDGSFVILGTEGTTTGNNVTVIKTTRDGEMIWSKTYESNGGDIPVEIKPTTDGGFIIVSNTYDYRFSQTPRILRIDNGGNLLWDREYDNWPSGHAEAIEVSSDGTFLFTGYSGLYNKNAHVSRIDFAGNVLWKKDFYPDYLDYSWRPADIRVTPDGGICVLGYKGAVWSFENKQIGMWVMKTDEEGHL